METEQKNKRGIAFAILAAALYAINAPFSKILLEFMPPTLMAGFLYVGAGIGMIFIALMRKIKKYEAKELKLTKSELPYTIAMIVLDIAAPICLLFGLNSTTAANASLLNNFEIVATAIIALMVFKEKISTRLWFGIFFVTLSCGILSFEDVSSLRFSYGSLFVLLATICWGFENNCTRKISSKGSIADCSAKRNIFGYRFPHYRLVYWRTDRGTLEYRCCSLCRICGIWIEYLLLCICTKITWCSTNKCILCRCSIYSGNSFVDYL